MIFGQHLVGAPVTFNVRPQRPNHSCRFAPTHRSLVSSANSPCCLRCIARFGAGHSAARGEHTRGAPSCLRYIAHPPSCSPERYRATAFARSSGATTRSGHGLCIVRAAGAIAKRRAFATRASVLMQAPDITSHYPAARALLNRPALQRSPAAWPNPAVNRTRRHMPSRSRVSARRAGYLRR